MSSFLKENKFSSQPKIALVHDDFIQAGGAESLFATIASIYKDAPIYTAVVDWRKLPQTINRERVITSWIQKIPFAKRLYKILLPFYPLAFEGFDFDKFDVVISSTTRFAKSIITKPKTCHICYLNNVPRFLWDKEIVADYLPNAMRILLTPFFSWLKRWDKVTSARVDYYIANSQNVARALNKIYQRQSDVVYPFANLQFFKIAKIHNWKLKSQNYFLVVTRLVKWKKIDLAIKSCALTQTNLIIVGEGPDKGRLQTLAKRARAKVQFTGKVTREKLRALYQNCQALIVSQKEDFGIAAVEAQACGRPVIAFSGGGQSEIIKDRETGLLFKTQSEEALQDAIQTLTKLKWSELACRKNSQKFSRANFIKHLKNKINFYAWQSRT